MKGKKHALIIGGQINNDEVKLLEDCGYVIEQVISTRDAVERLTSNHYDRVITAEGGLKELIRLCASSDEEKLYRPVDELSPVDIDWQLALAEIVANSTEANLAYLDPNFNFVWVNSAYAERFGRLKNEFIGRSYFDFPTSPDDLAVFERVRDTGLAYTAAEKPYEDPLRPGLEPTYWKWSLVPIRHRHDPVGTTRGFALTMVDVTHDVRTRKEIERLREQAEKQAREMSAVFEAMTDAVIVYDKKGTIIYVNPAASKAYGLNLTEFDRVALRQMLVIRAPNGQPIQIQDLPSTRALRGETVEDEQFVFTNAEGQDMVVLASSSPLMAGKTIVGAVMIWHDITELQRAQQREQWLEEQEHEFYKKTILAATDGKLEITRREEITKMVGDPIRTWDVAVADELAAIREEAREIAEDAGMDLERVYALLSSLGEATSNVIKHAGKGTTSIHRTKDGFIVVVSDQGQGIGALNLPDVALVKGYSTAGTGGLGYKMIIRCSDKVYLATGAQGTTVAFEVKLKETASGVSNAKSA